MTWHASEEQRLAWVSRHQPGAQDAVSWWLRLFLQIEHAIHSRPGQRVAAAHLYLWAVHSAQEQGAFTVDETAIRIAAFTLSLRSRGYGSELTDVLPTADQVVRACLNVLPITLDHARIPLVLSSENLPAMRTSRQAKNLISAAAFHLPDLHDQALIEKLRAWIAAKPNLG